MSDLLNRRRTMMCEKLHGRELPAGYSLCAYLENQASVAMTDNTNFKYFDIGINPDETCEYLVKFSMINMHSNDGVICAPCGYSSGGANGICYYNSAGNSRCSFGTADLGYDGGLMPRQNGVDTVVRYSWKDKYIKNETTGFTLDCSSREYVQPSEGIRLFFRGYGPYSRTPSCKVYWFKMWQNGVLIRDYIPCLDSNGVPCFYDAASAAPVYATPTGRTPFGYSLA